MILVVIMDIYNEVNVEIDENFLEYEMVGFFLCYLKFFFGDYFEFKVGDEVWRKFKEKGNKIVKIESVKENFFVLKE